MALTKLLGRRNDTPSVIRRVRVAADKCGCTIDEFFELAKLAGSPPIGFEMAAEVELFCNYHEGHYRVPKFVSAFAEAVLDRHCPGTCPRIRGPVCRPAIYGQAQAGA